MALNPIEAPLRKLMGPGPLDIHPRVYRAMAIQGYKTDLSAGSEAAMSLLNA